MRAAIILIKRNMKLFFKDKGMFFTSLVTPAILLVLYVTFLQNIYRDSILSCLPTSFSLPNDLLDGLVGGQLVSSLLAVSCVTVAFCSNFLMVQDRANGTINDLRITPIKSSILSISYYIASLLSTLLICFVATFLCLIYLGIVGFYLTFLDVILLFVDVILLSLFGTALSSIINLFLTTQGQISAVGTIVSAGYGFICGAYMPISSFGQGLQKALLFLPGTYATGLFRNHAMQGAFTKISEQGIPQSVITSFQDLVDCNFYFFSKKVDISIMYLVIIITDIVLVGAYILLSLIRKRKAN